MNKIIFQPKLIYLYILGPYKIFSDLRKIYVFKLWCWRRLWRVPWRLKELKLVNPKGNQPCALAT